MNALSRLGVVGTDFHFNHLDEITHLFSCGTGVHCGVEVEVHLAGGAGHAAQGSDGCKLTALCVEVVTNEDVAKEMLFEKRVNSRCKKLIARRRRNLSTTAELGTNFCPIFVFVEIDGNGRGFFAVGIIDTGFCAFVHHSHERVNSVETAWKPGVGIELNEHFFDFVDRQACLQSFHKVAFQGGEIAIGGMCSDRNDVAVALSANEFKLLKYFLMNPRRVLTRDMILDRMGSRSDTYDRSIDVQISRLRSKLRDSGRNASLIRTLRGDGYMLVVPVSKAED